MDALWKSPAKTPFFIFSGSGAFNFKLVAYVFVIFSIFG